MVNIKVEVDSYENAENLIKTLKQMAFVTSVEMEDEDDKNLKPMSATDFYKRINAANLAQKENRLFSQQEVKTEVASW
jgi:hypothetical protein